MTEQNAYVTKTEAKLEEINAEIARFQAKAKGAAADAQLERARYLKELEQRRDEAKEKLASLRDAGADAFGDVKKGVEDAWTRLEDAAREARERFK